MSLKRVLVLRGISGVCVVGALLLSGVANAEPDEVAKAVARTHMGKGEAARRNEDLESALENFKAADAIMQVPTTALEVARTQAALGQLVEARETLQKIEEMPEGEDDPKPFQVAREAAQTLAEELEERIPVVKVVLEGSDDRAQLSISIDDEDVDSTIPEDGYPLNPGKHTIKIEVAGHSLVKKVRLQEKERVELSFVVPKKSPAPMAVAPKLPPRKRAPEPQSSISPWVYGLGGLAIVGVGAGTYFGLSGRSQTQQLMSSCAPRCAEAEVAKVQTTYTLANVSFIVGGGAAVSGLVLFLITRKPSSPSEDDALEDFAFGPRNLRIGFQTSQHGAMLEGRGSF